MKEEITWKFRKYLETNENENTIYQDLRDAARAVGREKFIAVSAYMKKESSQINNLTLYLKKLEKEKTKPQICRTKD